MGNIFETIGQDVETLVLYQQARTKEGKKIVAEVYTSKGKFFITDNAFKRDGEKLKQLSKKIYYSKTDYREACRNHLLNVINKSRYSNKSWVKCWECGRAVEPGGATWDGNGWYCGC